MENFEIEKRLSANGFSNKDIEVIRKFSEKDQVSPVKTISDLRKRFVGACVMLLIMCAFWIEIFLTGEKGDLESYSFAMLVGAAIIYFSAPLILSYKAFSFLRKYPHLVS